MPDSLLYIDSEILKEYLKENTKIKESFYHEKDDKSKEESKEEIKINEPLKEFEETLENIQRSNSEENLFEESKLLAEGRVGSLSVSKNKLEIDSKLDFDIQRMQSGTTVAKHSKEEYMSKIQSFIPIENRIYKSQNT
eukprot:CAMPEP_0205807932 /NCGR_PEP_ID=MMETSP0205-20121125/11753_1 /ASSEMBLY_ACC=CAM_ASM_000278 /TAXON_ID=36767 /ORGANISM="Euplotes focardii, Strain TN1" /LENGTH=137 /DNA_ID=CAMNT_0053082839 /DNA_START=71 /DNA_END=484 /DNA_ORIENTATION=-